MNKGKVEFSSLHKAYIKSTCKIQLKGILNFEFIIAVWGTFLPLPFRSFSLAFLANRSRRGLTLKSRRDERPQTGALAPGNVATTEKAPRGRQRPKHVVIKHVTYSVALLGLIIVLRPYPGGFTPVCGLSRLRRLFSGQQYKFINFELCYVCRLM